MIGRKLVALGAVLLAASASAQPVPAAEALAYRLPGHALDVQADTLRPPPDLWIARDKALHTSASFLLTLSGQYVLTDKAGLSNGRALPVAAGTALALGVLKEIADCRRPRDPLFSWRDLAANALGVGAAALVTAW